MVEDYWVKDKRITAEYVTRELVRNYIEEFGFGKVTRKKARFIVEQGI